MVGISNLDLKRIYKGIYSINYFYIVIMEIDNKTREERITRWEARKRIWGGKLESAKNQTDTDVANLMIEEAKDALSRLGVKGEVVSDVVKSTKSSSKSEAKKPKHDTSTPLNSKDNTSSLGV